MFLTILYFTSIYLQQCLLTHVHIHTHTHTHTHTPTQPNTHTHTHTQRHTYVNLNYLIYKTGTELPNEVSPNKHQLSHEKQYENVFLAQKDGAYCKTEL